MSSSVRSRFLGRPAARVVALGVATAAVFVVDTSPASAVDMCTVIVQQVPSSVLAGKTDEGASDQNGDGYVIDVGGGWYSVTAPCSRLGLPSAGTYERTFGSGQRPTQQVPLIPLPSSTTPSASGSGSTHTSSSGAPVNGPTQSKVIGPRNTKSYPAH